jgi:hypothetical protein
MEKTTLKSLRIEINSLTLRVEALEQKSVPGEGSGDSGGELLERIEASETDLQNLKDQLGSLIDQLREAGLQVSGNGHGKKMGYLTGKGVTTGASFSPVPKPEKQKRK